MGLADSTGQIMHECKVRCYCLDLSRSEKIYGWHILQVVGLRNGWQTALVMSGISTKIHAKRLTQATEVVLELRASGALSYLSLQGPSL